ncbi:MAG: hypothetical protein ACLFTH_01615 [Candidatus Woesearchaeota archaeon]
MGFGSIAANILLFLGVVIIASTFIFYMNSYASETSAVMTQQKNEMVDELNSDISITSSLLNTSHTPDQTILYAKNTGSTRLTIDDTDVYIDGARVPSTSVTITVEEDTDIGNPDLWDPDEVVKIEAEKNVDSGAIPVKVITTYSASDQVQVSS